MEGGCEGEEQSEKGIIENKGRKRDMREDSKHSHAHHN